MARHYTTRFVVRCTEDFKGAYLGLCEARGVTASDEIRAFVARELSDAAANSYVGKKGQNADIGQTADGRQAENSVKCSDTVDMFDKD